MTCSTRPQRASDTPSSPPAQAQSPEGMTAVDFGVVSQVPRSAVSMWQERGPVHSRASACRGDATKCGSNCSWSMNGLLTARISGDCRKMTYQTAQDFRSPSRSGGGSIAGLRECRRDAEGGGKDQRDGMGFDRNRLSSQPLQDPASAWRTAKLSPKRALTRRRSSITNGSSSASPMSGAGSMTTPVRNDCFAICNIQMVARMAGMCLGKALSLRLHDSVLDAEGMLKTTRRELPMCRSCGLGRKRPANIGVFKACSALGGQSMSPRRASSVAP